MEDIMQKLISLTKRRGFIFPSSELYGGFGSVYDAGPLGTALKNNIKKLWWEDTVQLRNDVVGLDSGILMAPKIWEASGHLSAGFADKLAECKKCKKRFKLDTELKECPECGGDLGEPRQFNLMMKTFVGPLEDTANTAYMRAETCQGIFVNFKNVLDSSRVKIPFGIAQIGKSFRNEITPGNFIFRMREFEQMEMEFFCNPNDKEKSPNDWFEEWKERRLNWYIKLGIKKENLRLVEVPKEDRSHYAQRQIDLEYHFPFGWKEIEGIHNRGDWDLSNHSKFSGQDLQVLDEEAKQKYFPHVIETSVGVERSMLAFLCEAYEEVEGGRSTTTQAIKEVEINLNLPKRLAPITVAVLPLVKNKEEITGKAREIDAIVRKYFVVQYDETGTIGKRYRRQDEIGTPYCVTIDFETLADQAVTVRDRATMSQERVAIADLVSYLTKKLEQ